MSSSVALNFRVCPDPQCKHQNELSDSRCGRCDMDLHGVGVSFGSSNSDVLEGPTVEGETIPPSGGEERLPVEQTKVLQAAPSTFCLCPAPIPALDGVTCGGCSGLIRPANAEPGNDTWPDKSTATRAVFLEMLDRRYPIDEAGIVVGRDSAVVAPKIVTAIASRRGVSARHAFLAVEGDVVLLTDLASRNGTWTQTRKLAPYAMARIAFSELPYDVWLGGNLSIRIVLESSQ